MSEVLQKLYKDSKLLMRVDESTGIDRMHLHQDVIAQYISREKVGEYFKFCIIRNPYDRTYSAWNFVKNRYPYDDVNDFVKHHLSNEFIFGRELVPMDCRVHYRPQFTFIYDEDFNFNVNYIIRYEALNEDIQRLTSLYGPGSSKNIFKEGITPYGEKYQTPRYLDRLDQDSILKINQLYEKDFVCLKYTQMTFD